ncbi:MAG: 50S ribosomal protein L11 methyltransferase [Saprospiraceae bacterium]|nr:50S ribosomal protein L11 methyltransferase [Saprospiraceae bacterium]
MNYYQYTFVIAETYRDILLAMLSELPFDTFEETPEGLHAFIPEPDTDQAAIAAQLLEWQQQWPFQYEVTFIPAQNWNAVWEANFQPIVVDDFCGVRADFHEPSQGVEYELVINPKMAFGTGHHETTYMMMQAMRSLPLAGARVLDYGCGTGILAILAAKMGASLVDAVDIEEESAANSIENARLNQTPDIKVFHGTLDAVGQGPYDVILANINRNVILESLPALYAMTASPGVLLISGVLQTDEDMVTAQAESLGFRKTEHWHRGRGRLSAFSS